MTNDDTEKIPNGDSFQERVFARFDALDVRLSELDERLQKLEQKTYDTKPIWERALAEILGLGQKLDTIERKLNILSQDMLTLRADQTRLEDRLEKIEPKRV
jgi:DNA repair exonuclease SbcCD ATPase subunit